MTIIKSAPSYTTQHAGHERQAVMDQPQPAEMDPLSSRVVVYVWAVPYGTIT